MYRDIATGGTAYGGSVTVSEELLAENSRRRGLFIYVIGAGSLFVYLGSTTAVTGKGIQVTATIPFTLSSLHYTGPVQAVSGSGAAVTYSLFEAIE